jgi:hypothetical protein
MEIPNLTVKVACKTLWHALANSARGRLRAARARLTYFLAGTPSRNATRKDCIAIVSGMMRPTPPVGYGGVEATLHTMALALCDRGWEVHLWGMFLEDQPQLYQGLVLHHGTDPEASEITRLNPAVAYLAWPSALQLERLAANPCRVVVGEFNHPSCLPPRSADIYVRCMNSLFARDARQAGYPDDRVVVVSYWQKNETCYQPDIEREDWLLWVGRPDRTKALEEAFRFAMLTGETVHIYAPWYPGEEHWAQVLERVRPANVIYCGELPRVRKPEVFSRCRALLYTARPDYKEAFGLIFLEALASGTPVVALDHHIGSTQSMMFPGPPLGLRAPDTDALAGLWKQHAGDLDPQAVYSRYLEQHDPEVTADVMDRTLRDLVAERTKTR